MRALRSLSVLTFIAAASCARDRTPDSPTTSVALVLPDVDAAAPTIRPPQRSDYLELPAAAPPTGSASIASEELEGIDIEECRFFLTSIKRCFPEASYREIVKNIRRATQEPSARDAVRDICKRMTDSYSQAGMTGINCNPP